MIFALAPEDDKDVLAYCDSIGISYPQVWCKVPGQVVAELRVREQGDKDAVILPPGSGFEREALVWAIAEAKAQIRFLPKPKAATALGKAAEDTIGLLRDAYVALTEESSNWLALAKSRAKSGGAINGRPPYGYCLADGKLSPHPMQAKIVAEVFKRRDDGASNSQIATAVAKIWRKSGAWDGCRVSRILKRMDLYRRGVYKTTSGIITNPTFILAPLKDIE